MHSYRICGLSVACDIHLPGLIAGAPDCEPQVTIRRGEVPDGLDNPKQVGPTWQLASRQFLLHVPNVARFLLKDGEQIVFAAESEAAIKDIPIFVLGGVFGILLHQREQVVLHASAVEVGGKAIVFCGSSGAGKSTLAAALAQHGYHLLNDDVCALTLGDGRKPIVHPDGRQLKLWAEAIENLELEHIRRERVRGCLEKFYVQPRNAKGESVPLGAVYVLHAARPTDKNGIKRLNVVDAALLLRDHAYRPLLVSRLDQNERYFRAAAEIADKAGVFLLTRPLKFDAMADVVSWLERHWREIGVTEQMA